MICKTERGNLGKLFKLPTLTKLFLRLFWNMVFSQNKIFYIFEMYFHQIQYIMYAHDWYSGNFSDFELGCFVIMLQLYNINHKDSKEMLNIILQTLI